MKEQMPKQKEEDLNSLYEVIPSAIFTVDAARRITSWNNKAVEITAYSAKEVIGKECTIFSESPCKEKCGLYSDSVAKPIIGKECKIRKKEGQICTVLKNSDLLRDKDGNIVGGIESFEDVSKHKDIEAKLEELRTGLELRVRVRTADLSKANEDLHKEIKERRIMEGEILRLRDFYGSTLDNIKTGVWVADKDGVITYANKGMSDIAGIGVNNITGTSLADFPKETLEYFMAYYLKAKALLTPVYYESISVITPAGRQSYQTGWLIPVVKNSEFNGMICTVEDVSERNKFEYELKKFKFISDNSTEACYLVDKDGRFVYVNITACKRMGYTEDELLGLSVFDVDTLYDKKGYQELFNLIQIEDIPPFETIGKRKDGTGFPVEISVTGIKFGEDKFMVAVARDITERKKAQEALRESEERFGILLNKSFDGIFIHENFVIIDLNEQMAKILGCSANELIGANIMDFVTLDSRKSVQDYVRRDEKGFYEVKMKRKDGGIIDVEAFGANCKFKRRDARIVAIKDITARKLAEGEQQRLNSELLKTNKRLKQLTLTDSHTGLYNHRYLVEVIEAEFHRAKRYTHPLAVIMLDIDYFKSINDVYGHQFGDLVLKQFAKQLKMLVRKYDMVVRFGGEEFVIISPGIDRTQVLNLGQRILDALNLYNFGNKKHSINLKLSLAVASYPEDRFGKGMDLINAVDQILNNVKELGGNKVYSSLDVVKNKRNFPNKREKGVNPEFLRIKIAKLTKKANQGLIESISAFAKTIKLKDRYTGEHVGNTVRYVSGIGKALGLSKDEIEVISQAAVLHDLGKIGISDKILLKKGRLTKKEFEEIKKHPQIGADIIRPIQFLHELVPLILYHHERWDGKGYPTGLKGERIPVGARIIAIADVYQSLISDRPYRKAYPEREALKIIKKSSGTHFDPEIVKVFLKVITA